MNHRRTKDHPRASVAGPSPDRSGSVHKEVTGFALRFLVLSVVFYGIVTTSLFQGMLSSYLEANAKWAASVLRILGQESDVIDNRVIAPGFTLTILAECTASGLFSFLVAGILAFPTPAVRKMAGIALCMVTIAFLNLVRILTLFLAGVWQPRLFDLLHEDIWPVVFIITTFALALTWVRWISADRLPSSEKRPCGKTSSALF